MTGMASPLEINVPNDFVSASGMRAATVANAVIKIGRKRVFPASIFLHPQSCQPFRLRKNNMSAIPAPATGNKRIREPNDTPNNWKLLSIIVMDNTNPPSNPPSKTNTIKAIFFISITLSCPLFPLDDYVLSYQHNVANL
jgi:hypothetical protein